MNRMIFGLIVAFFQILQETEQNPTAAHSMDLRAKSRKRTACGSKIVEVTPFLDSSCGDWIPFKNEKCIKLISQSGLQSKEDAEIVCKAFVEELRLDDVPKLVTVKTEEKQKFLEELLFKQLEVLENVWLGLNLGSDGVFRWDDGTDLIFSNWGEEATLGTHYNEEDDVQGNMADRDRNCVHMESGEGVYDAGKWVRDNCKKRNTVVCERDQPWTVATLQNFVLNLKLEVEQNQRHAEEKLVEANQKINEANQKINEANQKITEANQKISEGNQNIGSLQKNPVPLGFVYVQLPGQQSPSSIWPNLKWSDVSSTYAGLFFRVTGGNAAPFNQLQNDNSPRFSQVQYFYNQFDGSGPHDIPRDGSWSKHVISGGYDGAYCSMSFRMTTGEVRPINKAVIVWQRTG